MRQRDVSLREETENTEALRYDGEIRLCSAPLDADMELYLPAACAG